LADAATGAAAFFLAAAVTGRFWFMLGVRRGGDFGAWGWGTADLGFLASVLLGVEWIQAGCSACWATLPWDAAWVQGTGVSRPNLTFEFEQKN
jgi:hypothetical protein